MRNCIPQGMEAIIQRQECALAEAQDHRFLFQW